MTSQQQKTEIIVALMAALDKRKFKFAADQFSGAYLNRHLSKVPTDVLRAMTAVDEADKSWAGAFILEGSIELAKRAMNVSFLPIGEVASLFSAHQVDVSLLDEIFATLSPLTIFTGIKYTLKVPELVTCVAADDLAVSDAAHFADLVQQINIQMLSRTSGKILGQKPGNLWAYVIYAFFEPSNLSIVPGVTSECQRGGFFSRQKTFPLCLDIPNRTIHAYKAKNYLNNRNLTNEIFA